MYEKYRPGKGGLKPWLMCHNIKQSSHNLRDADHKKWCRSAESLQVREAACTFKYMCICAQIHTVIFTDLQFVHIYTSRKHTYQWSNDTSTCCESLMFGNGWVIWKKKENHPALHWTWLLIHVGITDNPCYYKGPLAAMSDLLHNIKHLSCFNN